jgi:hypothetical protein
VKLQEQMAEMQVDILKEASMLWHSANPVVIDIATAFALPASLSTFLRVEVGSGTFAVRSHYTQTFESMRGVAQGVINSMALKP